MKVLNNFWKNNKKPNLKNNLLKLIEILVELNQLKKEENYLKVWIKEEHYHKVWIEKENYQRTVINNN